MELAFHFSRWLHIVAGFLALLIFWIPIVTKKGGKTHNRIGWIYVYAMTIVSISALYMGIFRIFLDPTSDQDRISFSWFLIFISILSGASAWYGIRVLRFKRRQEKHRNVWDLMFPILLLLSGAGISIYGFTIAFPLLQYFPLLGIFLGVTHLLYWLKAPRLKNALGHGAYCRHAHLLYRDHYGLHRIRRSQAAAYPIRQHHPVVYTDDRYRSFTDRVLQLL